MIPITKTISYIENLNVVGGRPKSAAGLPSIVRAPKFMKAFRCTFLVNPDGATNTVWIASVPTNLEEQCITLSADIITSTLVPPASDITQPYPQIFVFDRRGVGYMTDEFYLYGEDVNVRIVWEGIIEQFQ